MNEFKHLVLYQLNKWTEVIKKVFWRGRNNYPYTKKFIVSEWLSFQERLESAIKLTFGYAETSAENKSET